MTIKKIIIVIILSLTSTLALFSFTNPNDYGLLYATIALLLFYILNFSVILLILKIAYENSLNSKKMIFISSVLGSIVPLILAFSSLSKIEALDLVLIVLIPIIIVWYVQKRGIL